ncbi:MAG: SDR family oxidoreductase [Synergistaceae bacterium]|jgi:NAD(P)-dependent dehydrogenase (short-subunit alcohol dehydrogenase family)|nr:SDR family oxidoreductase [Synergistaceae bacterium]
MLLKGKVALVTGGGSGIGRGISIEFAKEGARVVVADLNLEDAKATEAELKRMGALSASVRVDVSSPEQVEAMVELAVREYGTVDIAACAAGIDLPAPAFEQSFDVWKKTLAVNLDGVYLVNIAVGRVMRKNGGGKIVNLGSCCSKTGELSNSAYCASKAGVMLLTDCLSKEWAQYNIRVNAICPATIDTPMIDHSIKTRAKKAGRDAEEFERELLSSIPMNRRGKPSEVGRLAVFLASGESSFMTGQAINITGGLEVH